MPRVINTWHRSNIKLGKIARGNKWTQVGIIEKSFKKTAITNICDTMSESDEPIISCWVISNLN
jgi:hypothetical protein